MWISSAKKSTSASTFGSGNLNNLVPRAGIDGGGVFKEFLTSLVKEVFDSDRGLWLSTKQHELYPNPHSYATDSARMLPMSLVLT